MRTSHRRRRRPERVRPLTPIELALVLGCLFFLGVVMAVALSSCTSVGRCVFPPHADLCDPGDFDPRCLLDHCEDAHDAGPR